MSDGCRCGPGSGTARLHSPAATPGSPAGTARSTAVRSSFAGGRITANGATGAPCAPNGRRHSGRRAPRSRGRTPAPCDRRIDRFALPPVSNGRKAPNLRSGGCKSGNRRPGPRRGNTVGPERQGRVCLGQEGLKGRRLLATPQRHARRYVIRCGSRNRGSIDRSVRRIGRRGAGESCRSGRRSEGLRIRGRAARKSAGTAVAMMEAGGPTAVAMTEAGDTTVVATGAGAAEGTTEVAAAVEGAEESRQREGSSSRFGRGGRGGFAGE